MVDVKRRAARLHRRRFGGCVQVTAPVLARLAFGTAKQTQTGSLLQHRTTIAATLGRVVLVHKHDRGEKTNGPHPGLSRARAASTVSKGFGTKNHNALLLLVPFPVLLALLPAPGNVLLHIVCLVPAVLRYRANVFFGNQFFAVHQSRSHMMHDTLPGSKTCKSPRSSYRK